MKNNISFGRLESWNDRKTDTLNVDQIKPRIAKKDVIWLVESIFSSASILKSF